MKRAGRCPKTLNNVLGEWDMWQENVFHFFWPHSGLTLVKENVKCKKDMNPGLIYCPSRSTL